MECREDLLREEGHSDERLKIDFYSEALRSAFGSGGTSRIVTPISTELLIDTFNVIIIQSAPEEEQLSTNSSGLLFFLSYFIKKT